jgi:hypothetical protein
MSEAIEERVTKLEGLVKSLQAAIEPADIDSQYGDPEVRKDPTPKYWTGESCVGKKLSQCPADYLDAFAKYKDACAFMSEKEATPDKLKYAGYDRRDAKRARAWADRVRAGSGSEPAPF